MAGIYDVVAADYPSLEAARADFESLREEARAGSVRVEGMVLAEHDAAGHLRLAEAADGRGATAGREQPGVALVLTLLVGGAGEHPLPRRHAGAGVVVVLVDHLDHAAVPPALAGCPAELVLTLDEADVAALRGRPAGQALAP